MIQNKYKFYVVFEHGKSWWRFFLKPGFGHITLLCHDDFNWASINPGQDILALNILPFSAQETTIQDLIEKNTYLKDTTILEVHITVGNKPFIFPSIKFVTCTAIIKYLIGVKGWSFTPWQLYKYLTSQKKRDINFETIIIQERK